MIETLHAQDRFWLESFFSGRNSLKWEDVIEGHAPTVFLEQVKPWIASFANSGGRLPIVLPVFNLDGPRQWYGMASDEAGGNALAQELMAFVGPSFSDFRGQPLCPDTDDEIEKALFQRFGRFVFRLQPATGADYLKIVDALQLYLRLLQRRPDIPDRTQLPFGKVRAEFDRALLAGSESDAQRLKAELVSSGRIDVEQQKYLEIRMLAGLGRKYQLAHDYSLITSVLGLSLPTQTIADLVDALYVTFIDEIEKNGDDDNILGVFRTEIADNFGKLFLERKGVRQSNVLKAFLLYELVQTKPSLERCQAILSTYPEGSAGRNMVERWVKRLPPDTPDQADLYEIARQALADEDYELALEISLKAFPDAWTHVVMIRSADEIGGAEVAHTVLAALDEATEVTFLGWKERDLARLQNLRTITSKESIESDVLLIRPEVDWLSWVCYVESGRYDQSPLQILEDVVPRWSLEPYKSNPALCSELAERIGNASGIVEQTYRDAFTYLVEFFVDRPTHSVRGFGPLYTMMIRIVAWSGTVSANELELASTIIQALVNLAPSKQDYVEAVDAYAEILAANNAPNNIDWALNAAEMLAVHATPDNESRLRFFMSVVDMARSYAHRLSAVQFEILSVLAKDFSCPELMGAFTPQNISVPEQIRNEFAGLIGIYTLTESAGIRAQQFLKKILPQARVEVNADHVATEKLKNLAKNADIFVFAWRSSKHQAYYAAKDSRGSRQTLLPLGKGSASILDCVLDELGRIVDTEPESPKFSISI